MKSTTQMKHTATPWRVCGGLSAGCLRWLKEYGYWPSYKQGNIRVGKLIWEAKQSA